MQGRFVMQIAEVRESLQWTQHRLLCSAMECHHPLLETDKAID
jgi:hypothetical protein